MIVDGVLGKERSVETGVPQGSPVSPLLFLIYTAPLYEMIKELGARVSGFVDDITVHIEGDKAENASRLSSILKKMLRLGKVKIYGNWPGSQAGFIHFTKKKRKKRKEKKNPKNDEKNDGKNDEKNDEENEYLLLPNGEKKKSQSQVKLLGIILDEQLTLCMSFCLWSLSWIIQRHRMFGLLTRADNATLPVS